MDRPETNADLLLRLLDQLLPHVSRVIARTGTDPGVEALVRLLLTLWGRHQHAVAMADLMATADGEDGAEPERHDYTDLEACIAELARACA